MNQLILGIILTLTPLSELRIGLPLALIYAKNNFIPLFPVFLLILFLNLLLVFFIFLFLDHIHNIFRRIPVYENLSKKYLTSIQNKVNRFEKKYKRIGFLALVLFVAVPLPLTGAYTGSVASWALNLNRKKSILAISLGVLIAGLIIYLTTLGVFLI